MNLKKICRYQIIHDCKKSILIYYIVIAAVVAASYIGTSLYQIFRPEETFDSFRFGSMEPATIIFLFVAGMNTFKENFLLCLQNGISRRTLAFSQITTMLLVSTFMALADRAILLLGYGLDFLLGKQLHWNTLAEQLFDSHFSSTYGSFSGGLIRHFESLLFIIFLSILAYSLGYLITVLYYRMNKATKTAVSVVVPVFFFIIVPILEQEIFHGALGRMFLNAVYFIFGYRSQNPFRMIIAFLILSVVLHLITWPLTRKAVIKR